MGNLRGTLMNVWVCFVGDSSADQGWYFGFIQSAGTVVVWKRGVKVENV